MKLVECRYTISLLIFRGKPSQILGMLKKIIKSQISEYNEFEMVLETLKTNFKLKFF